MHTLPPFLRGILSVAIHICRKGSPSQMFIDYAQSALRLYWFPLQLGVLDMLSSFMLAPIKSSRFHRIFKYASFTTNVALEELLLWVSEAAMPNCF